LRELHIALEPPVLKTNSEGDYNLSRMSKFLCCSQHIGHQYHYLHQQVQSEQLVIRTILGKENLANILTKLTPMSSITITAWKQQWLDSTPNGRHNNRRPMGANALRTELDSRNTNTRTDIKLVRQVDARVGKGISSPPRKVAYLYLEFCFSLIRERCPLSSKPEIYSHTPTLSHNYFTHNLVIRL